MTDDFSWYFAPVNDPYLEHAQRYAPGYANMKQAANSKAPGLEMDIVRQTLANLRARQEQEAIAEMVSRQPPPEAPSVEGGIDFRTLPPELQTQVMGMIGGGGTMERMGSGVSSPPMGGGGNTSGSGPFITPDLSLIDPTFSYGGKPKGPNAEGRYTGPTPIVGLMPLEQAAATDRFNALRGTKLPGGSNLGSVVDILTSMKGLDPKFSSTLIGRLTGIDPEALEFQRAKELAQFKYQLEAPDKKARREADIAYKNAQIAKIAPAQKLNYLKVINGMIEKGFFSGLDPTTKNTLIELRQGLIDELAAAGLDVGGTEAIGAPTAGVPAANSTPPRRGSLPPGVKVTPRAK